jgi:hypothetical protein
MTFSEELRRLLDLNKDKPSNARTEAPSLPGEAHAKGTTGLPAASGSPVGATETPTPAAQGRVLLIHGYSADWKAFLPWKQALAGAGVAAETISVGNYVTLNNEVTIKDLGEAFDRALRVTTFAKENPGDAWTFDAVVHSTGMLVLREWSPAILTGRATPAAGLGG